MRRIRIAGISGQKIRNLIIGKLHGLIRLIYLPGVSDVNRVKLFANALKLLNKKA